MADSFKDLSEDAKVVQLLQLIAQKHNVIVDIDTNRRTINFLCGEEKQMEILEDLEKYFDCG